MSTLLKQRIIVASLAVLVLWPGVHHVLARHVDFDPWELFGWSMYAVPLPRVQVGLEERVGGRDRYLTPRGEELERLKHYGRLRTTLGEWAPTEAYARYLLEVSPERDAVTITLRRWHLERGSARLNYRDSEIEFER